MFVEFSMPGMDGSQTVFQIKSLLNAVDSPLPEFCCCSAFADECFEEMALSDGMDHFLVKPVVQDQLIRML